MCGNDMLNKVSFLFVFILSVAATHLLLSTKTLLLSRCTKTVLFVEEFLRPSRAPPWSLWRAPSWSLWRAISKGLIFFLTLVTKQFDGLLLWFGWRNKMLRKFFTEQVLILSPPPSTFLLIAVEHNLTGKRCCIFYGKSLNLLLDLAGEWIVSHTPLPYLSLLALLPPATKEYLA